MRASLPEVQLTQLKSSADRDRHRLQGQTITVAHGTFPQAHYQNSTTIRASGPGKNGKKPEYCGDPLVFLPSPNISWVRYLCAILHCLLPKRHSAIQCKADSIFSQGHGSAEALQYRGNSAPCQVTQFNSRFSHDCNTERL